MVTWTNLMLIFQLTPPFIFLIIGFFYLQKSRKDMKRKTLITSFSMIIIFLTFSSVFSFMIFKGDLFPISRGEGRGNKEVTIDSINKEMEGIKFGDLSSPHSFSKYVGLLTFVGLAAGGIFAGMLGFMSLKARNWEIMESLFFLLATMLFIVFLALAFRWWITLRSLGNEIPVETWYYAKELLKNSTKMKV